MPWGKRDDPKEAEHHECGRQVGDLCHLKQPPRQLVPKSRLFFRLFRLFRRHFATVIGRTDAKGGCRDERQTSKSNDALRDRVASSRSVVLSGVVAGRLIRGAPKTRERDREIW
jgi:hypothetical protein